ncbi:hypothetical protein Bca52824_051640 [Brassica carinata]|uniref:PGG domain-containing protein n=1 Tax=Brassica carinata TaxID=52824 RepID=A0A8X7R4U8_BRACI|nr:hypothetical protein Bca52824_051640 [Brassica carinata]
MSIVVDVTSVSDVVAQDENLNGSSSTSTDQDENIYQKIKKAAQDGDIERLYEMITPLHIAAQKGKTHFAMELMTLKPSLASKLNLSGFSLMHLALQNNHSRMVRGFLALDSSLVSIKRRGRVIPLHHVARMGDAELLSEFLFAYPSSIEDLTIKCETAVHVAVKNHQLMAFKVLLGWLKRVNKEEILDWKDEDGNTVFHIAASINHTEMIKLLRKTVKLKAKNLDGKTAMDILQTHQSPCFPRGRRLLHSVKERLLSGSTMTLAEYLRKNLTFMEKRNKFLGMSNLSSIREKSLKTSKRNDAILVVAVLIVTATYQVGLSPPDGVWQENSSNPTTVHNVHHAGQMTMPFNNALYFLAFNGFAFLSSLYVIILLIIGLPMWKLIYGSVAVLSVAMVASYATICPTRDGQLEGISAVISILAFRLMIVTMLCATFVALTIDKCRRRLVDFPTSCFCS